MNITNKDKNSATIRDVARLAGVSIKTVSRVTNKHPNVSDRTRRCVEEAISKLDYSVNPYAKYLGSLRAKNATRTFPVAAEAEIEAPIDVPAEVASDMVHREATSNRQQIDWW